MRKKLALDLGAMILILLSFAYPVTGNVVHEGLGFSLLVLFVAHNLVLNRAWYRCLSKGKYGRRRNTGIAINLLLLVATLILLVSGAINSRLIAEVLGMAGDVLPREVHTTAAYWFLVLMSVHLGMHWRLIMTEARKLFGFSPALGWRLALARLVAASIAGYGITAAFERNLWARLVAYFSFDYWGFGQSVWGHFGQYLAIVGVFVFLAHYGLSLIDELGS